MKNLLAYPPFYFLACVIIGIMLQFHLNVWQYDFTYLVYIFTAFLITLYFLKRYQKRKVFSLVSHVLFVFIGISTTYIHNPKNYANYYDYTLTDNDKVLLTIQKVVKSGTYYRKYIAKVSQINPTKTKGYVLLNIKKDSSLNSLSIGNRILTKEPFRELSPALNPHQFNYKNYLAKQYVYQQVFLNNQQFKQVNNAAFSITSLSANIRKKVQTSLKIYNFTKDELAVINALLLGQRQEISKELLESYTNAGAIHILAISGLHIGILLLLFSYLLTPIEKLPYGKTIKTVCIVVLLWSFAFIAGLSASVVRAVTMFTFVAVGQSFKRKKVITFSLISSMLFLLLIKPLFLFDVGFQLSYLAVFGIVWFQPLLFNLWKPPFKFLNNIWRLFTVSLAAQAGILPISLYYFQQFPGLFVLANLVIIPFLGSILFLGILIILLALLNVLPQFMAEGYSYIISTMNHFVAWISHQEDFLFKEISMSLFVMLSWYVFIILLYRAWTRKTYISIVFLLVSVVFLQIVYFYESLEKTNKSELLIFHKYNASILGKRIGSELKVFSSLNDTILKNEKILQSYRIGEQISFMKIDSMTNITSFKDKKILIVDSLGIYKAKGLKNTIVVLTNNPKINLKRLITTLKPQQIVADGSNYISNITKWEETCQKQKTPFWFTGQKGAYIIKN